MKLFLDRNKTLLPRIDVIFLLTRVLTLIGFLWYVLSSSILRDEPVLCSIIIVTFIANLSLLALAIRDRFDMKLAYLSAIIYDIIFVPIFIAYTGGVQSSMFVLFFLTVSVGAYMLTFWFATAVTVIVTVAYLIIISQDLTIDALFGVTMRIGFLWISYLAVAYASDYLRKSERRLMKLFDTLNMRTSELEKSQAQLEMIYENTRILAAILEPDGVVKEIARILGRTLQYQQFALVFRNRPDTFYYRARQIDGHANFHAKALDITKNDLLRKVADMHEPIRIKEIGDRDDYLPMMSQSRSLIVVPMTAHGQTQGLLLAEAPERDRFTDRDVQMLTVVARSAALAIENAELHRRTAELTIIDELTETFNYRYFVQKLQEEKKRATRYDLPLSLIMVDIDWFKKLNDSYGHEVGNVVLKELSRVIKSCIRDVDIFARYGGEEFVVILPQTPQSEAHHIGERIRSQVESTIIDAGSAGKVKITVSVGVSSFPENGRSHEELVSVADQALYRAKGSGKNLVCIA